MYKRQALSDDHFATHPDEINWGHVGTLNHYASLLRQITDAAFKAVPYTHLDVYKRQARECL